MGRYDAWQEFQRDGVLVYHFTVDDDDELYAIYDGSFADWIIIGTHTAVEWGL